jgi:hypothetical protein
MTRAEVEAKYAPRKLQWRHTIGPTGGTNSGDWLAFPEWYPAEWCATRPPLERFPKVDGDRF